MKIKGILTALLICAVVSCLASGCLLTSEPTTEPTASADASPTPSAPSLKTDDFEYAVNNGEVTLTRYIGTSSNVDVPSQVNDMPVTAIGMYCFTSANTRIATLHIPESVRTLGDYMCYNIETLTEIIIDAPDNIEQIGYKIICNTPAEKAMSADRGESLYIGKFIVKAVVSSDGKLELPKQITQIAPGAFEGVAADEVVLHDAVTVIDPSEFYNSSVKCVTIECATAKIASADMFSSVNGYIKCHSGSTAEAYALQNAVFYEIIGEENAWDYIVKNNTAILTKYNGSSKNIRIISAIESYTVSEIGNGENAFADLAPNQIFIPKTVSTVNARFAKGMQSLTYVYFEDVTSITSIGTDAFYGTTFENKTNVKDDMSVIGSTLTRHFGSGSIILPEYIRSIAGNAFSINVTSITVNEGCTKFSDDMLALCSSIEWIYIPNSITTLKSTMFNANQSIIIKCDAVSYAASFAQRNDMNVETIYYWDYSLNDDDMTATLLNYTGSQKNVTVPSKIGKYTVTSIKSIRNSSICKLTVPSTVKRLEDMFAYAVSSLEEIDFEDVTSLEYIGAQAFYGTLYEAVMAKDTGLVIINNTLVSCLGKGEITIPSDVKIIAPMAFYKSEAELIFVPESCTLICERAFASCDKLTWVYIPDEVTDIREHILDGSDKAYIGCHKNSFAEAYARKNGCKYKIADYDEWLYDIQDNNTVILKAYSGASADVIIPSHIHGLPVTAIGSYCFANMAITSVYIPQTITEIGNHAFADIVSLNSIVFENSSSIEAIGNNAFSNTPYFAALEAADGIYHINGILIKCTADNDVHIPYYIKHIIGGAFEETTAASVEINESCTSIGSGAFSNANALEWIYIPDGVTDIEASIITGSNKNVIIKCHENSVASEYSEQYEYSCELIDNVFEYSEIIANGQSCAVLTRYIGTATEVALPRYINGLKVIKIGSGCFIEKEVSVIYVPSSITRIGTGICKASLKNIVFENADTIEYIEKDAFKGTVFENKTNMGSNGLSIVGSVVTGSNASGDITLPNNIKIISGSAFNTNRKVTAITINNGCTTIASLAFADTSSLKWVFIPDSVSEIGSNILSGSSAYIKCNAGSYAEQYAIKNNIKYTLVNTDYEWSYTTSNGNITLNKYNGSALDVIIPSSIGGTPVTAIGSNCFADTEITSVYVPSSITEIGALAFANASALKDIMLENEYNVTYIGADIFSGTDLLQSFTDKNGFAIIGNVLIKCFATGNVTLYDNIKSVTDNAFAECIDITSVTLNNSCTYIGKNAFSDMTALEWICIPASVTNIEASVFANKDDITIKCYANSYAEIFAQNNSIKTELLELEFSFIENGSEITLTKYNGSEARVAIPSVINNMPVTGLAAECFVGKHIEYVYIPSSVTSIGNKCFFGISSLKDIVFENPSSITEIGNRAFAETMFESVTAVDNSGAVIINGILVKHFGSGDIVLSDNIKQIAGGAFFDRQDVTSVTINNGCIKIAENAFCQMRLMESIYIPDSVTKIEDNAFVNYNEQFYIACSDTSAAKQYAESNNISYRTSN